MKWSGARLGLVAIAVALLAALGGLVDTGDAKVDSRAKASNNTVKVGIIYSRTGLLSAYGAQYIQGLRLGLQYATKGTNRVNGHRIEITAVDDAGDPAKGVTAAKDLIGQGYKIIGGSTSSGVGLQIATLAEQNKVLNISGPAAIDLLTGANRYTFRSGRQSTQDVLAVREILGNTTGKRITVFAQDSAFGQGNVAAVRTILGGRGHTVTPVLVPLSVQDFTPFAERAKQTSPDLLFVAWAGTTGPAMWRAMEQQGVTRGTTIATGLAERATWNSYVPGIQFLSHYVWNAPKNKVNDWLVAKMRARNQVPDIFSPDGFNAALMIVRAVSRSGGGTDVDRMIGALEGWQFVGPKGVNRIRAADHALLQPMFHVRLQQSGNRFRPVPVKTFSPGNLQPPVRPFPS